MDTKRIPAYDLAKGFAVLTMVFVNASTVFSGLIPYAHYGDGRAFPVFLMLFGMGLSRSRASKIQFLRRAGTLLTLGFLLSLFWPYEILHVYAGLLFIGLFIRRQPVSVIWVSFFISLVSFSILFLRGPITHDHGWMIRYIYNGYFALLPQSAFMISGMLLFRYLRHRKWWVSLGGILFTATTVFSIMNMRYFSSHSSHKIVVAFCRLTPYPALPVYVGNAIGLSLVMLGLCMWCGHWVLWSPIQWIGRHSLWWYVGHVVVLGVLKKCLTS